VVVGGGRPDLPGAFVEPTILTGVTPAMRAYHEELFGPVVDVHRVTDDARRAGQRLALRRPQACVVAPDAPIGNLAGWP
jgi:acyl-CoA reductase-like NAD-dependent aldehyde dehydrogenase